MRCFRTDRRAIAAVEFALMLPVLAFALLASVDVVTWIRQWFGAERSVMALADLVSQAPQSVKAADFQDPSTGYFALATTTAQPLAISGKGGATIVSCLKNSTGTRPVPQVAWQYINTSNGSYVSKFGTQGSTAVLPNGFSLTPNETVIVAEIYSGVQPWNLSAKLWATMGSAASGSTAIYTYALYRPRLAQLC